MNTIEVILFVVAVVGVIGLGIWKSKDEDLKGDKSASDYFLAGRGLSWWLVGFSLIAANISTEQFVGMSGSAANWLGMAIASYEWMAAITLIFVAFWFLPKFLKSGLYTIPEFLEYRFGGVARLAMAIPVIVTLVFVTTSSVIFSGGKFVSEYYNTIPLLNNLTFVCWMIAIFAAVYVFIGGLKACAWTDLVWGAALILGGVIVMVMAFHVLGNEPAEKLIETKVANSNATIQDLENAGAWERFVLLNDGVEGEAVVQEGENGSGGKVHMIRPKTDTDLPWTALLIGLWIPNFFYWGLNQYIVQRTLGSKSLAEGQKGIVFAAFLKLLVPFLVVIPGILAFNLFRADLHEGAAENNTAALYGEEVKSETAYTFNKALVELQPNLIPVIFERNAAITGAEVPDLENTTDPEVLIGMNKELVDAAKAKYDASRSGFEKFMGMKALPVKDLEGYDYDAAFPVLVRNLIKKYPFISWFVLAALSGAVISSLASMLNSASTIATMDLYSKFSGDKDPARLVAVGRGLVVCFVILAALVAPALDKFTSIFQYIQEFQGFISPGILAVFIFGFFSPKTPRYFGALGIAMNVVSYGAFKWVIGDWLVSRGWWYSGEIAFLDRMALCFFIVIITGIITTIVSPLKEPVVMPVNDKMDLRSSAGAKLCGVGVLIVTIVLYIIFW